MSSLADKADEYPQPIKGHISHKEWEKGPQVHYSAPFCTCHHKPLHECPDYVPPTMDMYYYQHLKSVVDKAGKGVNEGVNDAVNHPAHYTYGPMECIEAMVKLYGVEKTIAYCKLAAFKYRWRAGYKGDVKEDIDKALNYEKMAKELKDAGNRA